MSGNTDVMPGKGQRVASNYPMITMDSSTASPNERSRTGDIMYLSRE